MVKVVSANFIKLHIKGKVLVLILTTQTLELIRFSKKNLTVW